MDVLAATAVAAFTTPQEIGEAEPLQAHIALLENGTDSFGSRSALPDLGHRDTTHHMAGLVAYNITLGHHFRDKFDSRLRWYEDYIVGSFLVFVGFVSFVGNGSSVIMFWRRYKNLTPAEVLLLNLAVIHLLLAIGSYPAAMVSSFSHRWVFHDLGCQLYGFVCYLIGIATIASMTALAVVRYLKTCTHTYSRTLTVAHVKVILIGVYMYALFWAIPPLFSAISKYEVEPFGTSCTLNWANPSTSSKLYIILATTFVVGVPYVVMTWCYLRIVLLVRRNHMKKTIMGKKSSNSQAPTQMQLTIVSIAVCIGYIVAWCPYAIVSLVYGIGGRETSVYVSLIPVLLAKSSCAYNPIIYVFVTARYRNEMKNILNENMYRIYCCFKTAGRMPAAGSFSDVNQSSVVRIPLDHVSPPNSGHKSPLQISPSPNTKTSFITKVTSDEDITCMDSPPLPAVSQVPKDGAGARNSNGLASSEQGSERMPLNPSGTDDAQKDDQGKYLPKKANDATAFQDLKNSTSTEVPFAGGPSSLGHCALAMNGSDDPHTPLMTRDLPNEDIYRPFYDIPGLPQARGTESNSDFEREPQGGVYCDSQRETPQEELISSSSNQSLSTSVELPSSGELNNDSDHSQNHFLQLGVCATANGETEGFLFQRLGGEVLENPTRDLREPEKPFNAGKTSDENRTNNRIVRNTLSKRDSNNSLGLECQRRENLELFIPLENRDDETSEESVLI
ncbi:melanopsin-like [Macrobrachium rosenbergii]|uniref:melanopsin-like n=1 Tax=Macrobrachium rosenbergii TaxID=79674 RepID=UPI0034D45931